MLRGPEDTPTWTGSRRPGRRLGGRRLGVAEMRQALNGRRQGFADRRDIVEDVARLELVQEVEDTGSPLERLVQLQVEFRDALDPQPLAQLVPNERHGPAERPKGLLAVVRLADDADEHLCMPEIRGRLDPGDRRKPDPRIGDLAGDDLGDLLPQEFVDSVRSGGHESISWQGLGKRSAS